MSKVFVGYDSFGINGVDDNFINFIFDIILSHTASDIESEMGLIITSDEYIKSLNHQYRGKDKPTNVLSFSNDETKDMPVIPEDKNYLGDVYISYNQLNQESAKLNISIKERFVQLFVHGTLHLIGLDHEDSQSTSAMESLEDKIVSSIT